MLSQRHDAGLKKQYFLQKNFKQIVKSDHLNLIIFY